jgi:hypothetical protein
MISITKNTFFEYFLLFIADAMTWRQVLALQAIIEQPSILYIIYKFEYYNIYYAMYGYAMLPDLVCYHTNTR